MSADRLPVVLCWHMHQPDYRGPGDSDYQLPWVYLHGIKDYVDMAAHLERNPAARAVVNFAPVLLEQLADYVRQIDAWLSHGERIRDPLLAALAGPTLPQDHGSRLELVDACRRVNEPRLVDRFPAFRRLMDMAASLNEKPQTINYLNDQYLVDLLVWYHLAWMGEFARENDHHIHALLRKEHEFDDQDRRRMLHSIGSLLGGLVERYRHLAEAGRVELSVTPYAHPIIPLLLDISSARESIPDALLPGVGSYPGGLERARWHIQTGIETFEQFFGFRPRGCWPAEGALSEGTLELLAEAGFEWTASGQQVLHNSLSASGEPLPDHWIHRGFRHQNNNLHCFFRDDGLSDLIGFTYSDWHADHAVSNLVQHLEKIAELTAGGDDPVVSIIMDGENAWEHYPENARHFLEALYAKLSDHPQLELTTYSALLDRRREQGSEWRLLKRLVSGSWVYGTLSTWIGDHDKNRAWEMLGDAKDAFDQAMEQGRLSADRRIAAERQLATCEGSDWFWWFGDYNPGNTVSDFEKLFRRQLTQLYTILGVSPPEYLAHVFAYGGGTPAHGGVMIRTESEHPR